MKKTKNYLVAIVQALTILIIRIPMRLLFKSEGKFQYVFEKGKKYILAANHPNRADPFLIASTLPFSLYLQLLPVRIITHEKFLKNPISACILYSLGSITTKQTRKGKVLERASRLLERGETILIFPSGRLEREGVVVKPKVGVVYLNNEVKDSLIVPIHLQYFKKPKRTVMLVKKAFRFRKKPSDFEKAAKEVYKRIIQEDEA
ncbi:hypothetical protein D6783_01965 [Candidatus Woesearchaeota archaeon]|nr:MAG: hypothetical protein D6783_01965 [Candidatus Woesearchaeota archaeon]